MATDSKLHTIYTPEGRAEQHTPANARDLISVGYSWTKKARSTPMDTPPFAVPPHKAKTTSAAQDVLDSVGKKVGATQEVEVENDEPEVDEDVTDEAETEVEVEEPTEAPLPRRRKKPTIAPTE